MIRIFTCFLFCVASLAGFSQGTWSPLTSGVNNRVESFTKDGSYLYVGGRFTVAGGIPSLHIARWNGTAWSLISQGVNTGTSINSMVIHNGQLYVAGAFTEIAGLQVKNVGKWNGVSWSPVGSGLEYTGGTTVSTLCVFNNELYAGGLFNNSAGVPVNYIAKWDGVNWVPVAGGTNGPVRSLCVYNNELYAAGEFTEAGGVAVKNISRYNGVAWNTVDSGLDSYTGATTVSTLRVYSNNLFAGGRFQLAGGDTVNNIAKWDGASWSDVGGGLDYTGGTTVSTIIPYNNNVYAGGTFISASGHTVNNIAMWDGSGWSSVGQGIDGSVYAMEVFMGSLYIGGEFQNAGSVSVNNIAKWDDSFDNPLSQATSKDENLVIGFSSSECSANSVILLSKDLEGRSNVQIVDISGKIVFNQDIDIRQNTTIKCSLTNGIYFYRISSSQGNTDTGKVSFR